MQNTRFYFSAFYGAAQRLPGLFLAAALVSSGVHAQGSAESAPARAQADSTPATAPSAEGSGDAGAAVAGQEALAQSTAAANAGDAAGEDSSNSKEAPAPAEDAPAVAVIQRLQTALEDAVARSAQEDCTDRADRLSPIIAEVFDIPAIARQVLRRHWQDLTEAQQAEFASRLRTLTVAGFASNFGGSTPISFTEPEVHRDQGKRLVVRSELLRENRDPVVFDFLLHRFEGRWRIINVVAQGVSEMSLRSSQYDAVIRSDGFEVLLDKLEQQVIDIREEC